MLSSEDWKFEKLYPHSEIFKRKITTEILYRTTANMKALLVTFLILFRFRLKYLASGYNVKCKFTPITCYNAQFYIQSCHLSQTLIFPLFQSDALTFSVGIIYCLFFSMIEPLNNKSLQLNILCNYKVNTMNFYYFPRTLWPYLIISSKECFIFSIVETVEGHWLRNRSVHFPRQSYRQSETKLDFITADKNRKKNWINVQTNI